MSIVRVKGRHLTIPSHIKSQLKDVHFYLYIFCFNKLMMKIFSIPVILETSSAANFADETRGLLNKSSQSLSNARSWQRIPIFSAESRTSSSHYGYVLPPALPQPPSLLGHHRRARNLHFHELQHIPPGDATTGPGSADSTAATWSSETTAATNEFCSLEKCI